MIRAFALALMLAAAPAAGAGPETAAEAALAAEARLGEARDRLAAARGARDRIAALTDTVRAYEDGLAAMREGLRLVSAREREIAEDLAVRETEISRLLAALTAIAAPPRPVMLLHPAGPEATARAAMLLSDVTPALRTEASVLAARLDELRQLRALQERTAGTLAEGLAGAQDAREALSAAVANRTGLPRRYAEDPVATAVLLAASESLAAFADGLSGAVRDAGGPVPDALGLKGSLALPVDGAVLRRAGERDAAGIARPGWVVATPPRALVTTPVAATLRYVGPLLDYGTVAILEPAPETLFVLAGLAETYGAVGEVLPGGAPVGLMGGVPPDAQAILTAAGEGAGATAPETLYIEVREGDAPVDPATWFGVE